MRVTFKPINEDAESFIPRPEKASSFIPEWYKAMPMHERGYDGNKISKYTEGTSMTVKGCDPFLDTLTNGYMFSLAADVEFSLDDNGMFLPKWLVNFPLIEGQAENQTDGMPRPYEPAKITFKWASGWIMNTPKGYSTLFTHPLNRHDLPFRTFSGIVETDKYPLQVDFPFQALNPNNLNSVVVKKGTPICQAIPFKRESWTSKAEDPDEKQYTRERFKHFSSIDRSYRNRFWERKTFS